MGSLCKWDGLDGTKIHNTMQNAIHKWHSYVSGTLESAQRVSHLLSPHCSSSRRHQAHVDYVDLLVRKKRTYSIPKHTTCTVRRVLHILHSTSWMAYVVSNNFDFKSHRKWDTVQHLAFRHYNTLKHADLGYLWWDFFVCSCCFICDECCDDCC